MEIDRSQCYSGGFFLVRAGHPGWDGLDKELIPEKLLSLSYCISLRFNLVWTWIQEDKDSALEFGIAESKWEDVKKWCSEEYQKKINLGGQFNSKQDAQYFIAEFISDLTDLYLIEVGLPKYLKPLQWEEPSSDEFPIEGVEKRIDQEITLLKTGNILGFDVVSFQYHNLSHSWLCSYIHRDMFDLYSIQPNQYGLISDYNDARKVYEWIAEDDMQGRRGEPEPYDFWLLVSHPLEEAPQE